MKNRHRAAKLATVAFVLCLGAVTVIAQGRQRRKGQVAPGNATAGADLDRGH